MYNIEVYNKSVESTKDMKIGDIIFNKWAGHIDCRYNILIGKTKNNLKLLCYIKGKGWHIGTHMVDKLFHDGTPAYIVVGHSDFIEIAKEDLQSLKSKERLWKR